MKVTAGLAHPGVVSAHGHAGRPESGGKDRHSAFGEVLHDAGKAAPARKHQDPDAAPHQRWAKVAAARLPAGDGAPGKTAAAGTAAAQPHAAKPANDDADDANGKPDDKKPDQGVVVDAVNPQIIPLPQAAQPSRDHEPATAMPASDGDADALSSPSGQLPRDASRLPDTPSPKHAPATGRDVQAPLPRNGQPLPEALPQSASPQDARRLPPEGKRPNADDGIKGDAIPGQPLKSARMPMQPSAPVIRQAARSSEPVTIADGTVAGPQARQSASAGSEAKVHDGPAPRFPPAPVAGGVAEPGAAQSSPTAKGAEAGPLASRSEPGRQPAGTERVKVVAEQNFPAPAAPPMTRVTADLVGAIASGSALRQAISTAAASAQPTPPVAISAHMLKIELHPAELGMVTASLRLAGGQLSIELRPETHEAHRRLSSDTDTIVKSLRGLGLDVDKVTLLQPQVAVTATPRPDAAGTQTTAAGRDQPSFQSGSPGGNGGAAGGQQSGRNRDNDGQTLGRAVSPARERAGGDLFI